MSIYIYKKKEVVDYLNNDKLREFIGGEEEEEEWGSWLWVT